MSGKTRVTRLSHLQHRTIRVTGVTCRMSKRLGAEIESIISRLLPVRLDVLHAEQHFARELDHVHLYDLESAQILKRER